MTKPLRSLSGLLDFDCAARWGSFKLAAQELHKTPAAISLQVKQLEEALGFDLFSRHPRHISLTEKGQEFSATVRRMLGDLNTKVAALQGGDEEKILRLSTTHSLAIKWLVPRIARFTKLHPDLDIRIDSSDTIANMEDGSTDIALRTYDVVRTDPDLLFHDRLVAVYSPSLVLPGETEITLADLERYPLLHEFTTDTWIALLRQNNALKGNYNFSRSFTNFAVMVQSALAGQGIALVSHAIASDDLRSGALKMVDCESAPYERGYRVIVARDKRGMSKITHFRAWLQEEVAEMQKGLQ
ncbi:LysR family transcriptional regulator [Pseudoduganella sp. FT26W]|uniref:LysR family transcriptional regulator n=1 Tax=Duganella aquatilis TaxID=2666082 RepID=A0A844DDH0_9BURK|nr:LysR substrate-binding domain-containing protein [Duganella aquatilis]MRW86070.1 LysR family transcriptional regulator [Duganella aquatilis]